MAIEIPATTLVCVDCQYPALALRALRATLAQCRFAAVKLLTDATGAELADPRIERVPIDRIASSQAYSHFMLKELLPHVATEFVQVVQWDGYVFNGAAWRPEFQAHDYIGARWWFRTPGRDVGNGGFSLRSRRLLQALQDPAIMAAKAEDHAICVDHRDLLESRYGIRFAPGELADHFAFEGDRPNAGAFGFHGVFNLPLVCDEAALSEVFAHLPDSALATPTLARAMVLTLRRLIALRREAEALRYARRLLWTRGHALLPTEWLRDLEQVIAQIAPAAGPCDCGSGRLAPVCCGSL